MGTLSIASTEYVDLKAEYKNIGIVKGSHQIPWILVYPLGNYININKAIEKTLIEHNINYLTDLRIDQRFFHFYLFGNTTITVKGIGWKKIESKYDPLTGKRIN